MGQESHPQQVTGEVNWDFQKSWPKKSIDPSRERKPFENQRETLRREVHFRKLVGHRSHHFENKPLEVWPDLTFSIKFYFGR